ncbi:hypothetical protein B0H63DRAFT_497750 [Podospora didyma]|uniref:Nephrocystin 3-like N-terminal domain-containing protein n=1 Tax=Podospora didyma TaxID=330526 RepID=A0AAE0N2N7_9PEZI|nr:hypothetical protein B0H63DRAFT_497750 [Podospora didyma]
MSSISDAAKAQICQLINVQEDVLSAIVQARILERLAFNDMHTRYDAIEDACSKTFCWMFGNNYNSETDDDEDECRVPSQRLIKWLSSGQGIFHISGKLGSGKSTLMKFLYEHRDTKFELARWAGERALVIAGFFFFFWKPGSALQKSLIGPLRSLLYDVLRQCPELIPTSVMDFPAKEASKTFSRLVQNRDVCANQCFCFFIDGLDEYEETKQEDRKAVVDLLRNGSAASLGNVELCVSSREDNVLLTDIQEGPGKRHIIRATPETAHGIFLWVALVVKSMRELLENGAEPETPGKMLETLPDELDSLFEHILLEFSALASDYKAGAED